MVHKILSHVNVDNIKEALDNQTLDLSNTDVEFGSVSADVFSEDVIISDNIILLSDNTIDDDSGIEIKHTGGNKSLIWKEANSQWELDGYQIAVIGTKPTTAGSEGEPGQIASDVNYLYVCVATDTWIRVAKTAW